MSLFGNSGATQQQQTNSAVLGDLSKDIALTAPPEDSISDISFSPQSDHLAVASWDKKVRIYEISQTGTSEGKALFEHELPVLSCHWSKVCTYTSSSLVNATNFFINRMEQRWLVEEQTEQLVC